MHTIRVLINDQSFKVTLKELLPLLKGLNLIVPDYALRIVNVISLLKTISEQSIVDFLKTKLLKSIAESTEYRVNFILETYVSIEQYEELSIARDPELGRIRVRYAADGSISNLYDFTKHRLEVEFAKRGFVYNFSTVDIARQTLRQVIDRSPDADTPSPIVSSVKTRSQTAREIVVSPSTSQVRDSGFNSKIHITPGVLRWSKPRSPTLEDSNSESPHSTASFSFSEDNINLDSQIDSNSQRASREIVQQARLSTDAPIDVNVCIENPAAIENQRDNLVPQAINLNLNPNMAANVNPLKLGIPRCYGDDPAEVEKLISELNKQKKVQRWTPEQVRQNLYLSLMGAALTWYEQEEVRLEQMDWDQLKEALRVRFQSKTGRTAVNAFLRRVQRPGETVLSYFEDKNRLKDLGGAAGLDEQTIIDLIIEGLLDEPQDAVMMFRNTTIAELKENLTRIGKTRLAQRNSSQVTMVSSSKLESMVMTLCDKLDAVLPTSAPAPAPLPVLPDSSNEHPQGNIDLLVAALTQFANKNNGKSEVTCHRCHRLGHYANQCNDREGSNQDSSWARGRTQPSDNNVRGNSEVRSAGHFNGSNSRNHSRNNSAERSRAGSALCQLCNTYGHTVIGCSKYTALLDSQKN